MSYGQLGRYYLIYLLSSGKNASYLIFNKLGTKPYIYLGHYYSRKVRLVLHNTVSVSTYASASVSVSVSASAPASAVASASASASL